MLLQRQVPLTPCVLRSMATPAHFLRIQSMSIFKPAVAAAFRPIDSFPSTFSWPPHRELAGNEAGSFAEGTITKRLPAIISSMLQDVTAFYKSLPAGSIASKQVTILNFFDGRW